MKSDVSRATPLAPLILIVTLFFLWGVANNSNDVLIPHFRKAFFLNDFQSSLVQSAFYLEYFFLALPAGWTIQRYGYKVTVLVGLVAFGMGAMLFYPAAELLAYGWFLAALFIIAAGLCVSTLTAAIIGGAVLTAVMGAVSDAAAINYAILVPTVCFGVVGWFAWTAAKLPVSHFEAAPAGAH